MYIHNVNKTTNKNTKKGHHWIIIKYIAQIKEYQVQTDNDAKLMSIFTYEKKNIVVDYRKQGCRFTFAWSGDNSRISTPNFRTGTRYKNISCHLCMVVWNSISVTFIADNSSTILKIFLCFFQNWKTHTKNGFSLFFNCNLRFWNYLHFTVPILHVFDCV